MSVQLDEARYREQEKLDNMETRLAEMQGVLSVLVDTVSAEEEERFSGDMTLKKGFNNDETEDHSVSKAPTNHPIPSA